jgi:hypothetical protein
MKLNKSIFVTGFNSTIAIAIIVITGIFLPLSFVPLADAQQVLQNATEQVPQALQFAPATESQNGPDEFGFLKVIKTLNGSVPGLPPIQPFNFRLDLYHFVDDEVYVLITTFPGSEFGWILKLRAGMQYNVEERLQFRDYYPTFSRDCQGIMQSGDNRTCTVTNNHIPLGLTPTVMPGGVDEMTRPPNIGIQQP